MRNAAALTSLESNFVPKAVIEPIRNERRQQRGVEHQHGAGDARHAPGHHHRCERKRVVQLYQVAEALTALFLAWGATAGWLTVTHIFVAAAFVLRS